MNIALVTGAPGWLGTALVQALVQGTSYPALAGEPRRVRCVVQPGVDAGPVERLGAEIVRADLRDARALAGACEGVATVFHGAGIIHPRRIQDLYAINVAGTRNLLAEAVRAGVRRFVLVSSNSPAGLNESAERLMTEDDPPRPYLNYGLSKLQAEWVVNDAHRAGAVEGVIVRPCWFYGPNQPARQSRFFRMIKSGKPLVIGRGDNLRSMSYIDNAVQGLILAGDVAGARGKTYWITDRRPYSFIEILETVAKILEVEIRPRYVPRLGSDVARFADSLLQMAGLYNQEIHVAGELGESIAVSIASARRDLGYEPQVGLEEGMRRSIAWCRANGVEPLMAGHDGRHALVTGGSGYFGCLLVAELRRRGYEVSVFDLRDVPDRAADVRYLRGDIRDRAAVAEACRGVDVIHHNVAQVPLAKDSALFRSVNVDGARNLLEAARDRGVAKTVLVSSSAVFGVPERNPVDASVEPRPREAYGAAKLEAERIAARFVEGGLDVTVIRPRTILGHGRLGIFQILFEWIRKGQAVYVLGRGDNRYQFVHADDLADACIRAGERPSPATYNVGAERFGTMREALEGLARHAGTGSRVRSLPMGPTVRAMELTSALGLSPLGPYHSLMYGREMFFDLTPARDELGWRATRSNEEMLTESYDYYVEHRAEILARRGASHHRSPLEQGILKLLEYLP